MPRLEREIGNLLGWLAHCTAYELRSQDLNFKQWDTRSRNHSVPTAVTSADLKVSVMRVICRCTETLANGTGRGRHRIGSGSPAGFLLRKCAKVARNSIVHALALENATAMRPYAAIETLSPRNANQACESGRRAVRRVPGRRPGHGSHSSWERTGEA